MADDVILQISEREGPMHYGSQQLEQALKNHGHRVVTTSSRTPLVIELNTLGEGPAEGYHTRWRQEEWSIRACSDHRKQ